MSYMYPILLEQSSSPKNKVLEVVLTKGRKQLSTEDAIYSFDDKYINFKHSFDKINWNAFKGNRVLVLGLGLGSVISMLEKNYSRNFEYVAIEIDEEICRLCSKYTLTELNSIIEVFSTDAYHFLRTTEETFDLIIMDIFQSAKIPSEFMSNDFIELLHATLSQEGMLLYNTMHITEEDKSSFDSLYRLFTNKFPNAKQIPINKNIVIINDKNFLS